MWHPSSVRTIYVVRCIALVLACSGAQALQAVPRGDLTLQVTDLDSGKPIPIRMHLHDQRNRSIKPPKLVGNKHYFVFDREITLSLKPGQYSFQMERGPEYRRRRGSFTIDRDSHDIKSLTMQRFVDMSREGWWAGDLAVTSETKNLELLMRAEDLHVAPVVTWDNQRVRWQQTALPQNPLVQFDENRFMHLLAGQDSRLGGTLRFFNAKSPLETTKVTPEFPSAVTFLKQARDQSAHVDIGDPFSPDLPLWIASGMTHSLNICSSQLVRDLAPKRSPLRPFAGVSQFPDKYGNGDWAQQVYYHLLNCGLRIPMTAGSGFGENGNPLGNNRVYVYCGTELTWEHWWRALQAGRTVVTNGPMLRPRVNNQLPGFVFEGFAEEKFELEVGLKLSMREKVDYLEIVKNGQVIHHVMLDEYAKQQGRLPKVEFSQSGWMLVRAVVDNPSTYQFASSGPYYVKIGETARVSRNSAQFFLDWLFERAKQLDIEDPQQKQSVLRYHRAARDFWQKLLASANAE